MVVFDRENEWQAGYVIVKGGYKRFFDAGIAELQLDVARLAPWLADRVGALDDWKKTHMLTVQADRLRLGTSRGCSSSATPRTRCRRSEESASTTHRRCRGGRKRALGKAARGPAHRGR
jgi:hypothetical protein